MAMSVPILAIITALHLIAFVFAVGAERRRSFADVEPDQYDERTYCHYSTDASTVYGLCAFGLLLLSQHGMHTTPSIEGYSVEITYHALHSGKGLFAAGAALTLLSLVGSILYYWAHSRADTGGWEKHQNEGLGMTQQPREFEKV
ncbi:hypothetical protein F3Y22_tig00110114pilonHSYRG00114 [Hibiscus syriacus]|uniref:Uncharacterized protein n=1 Tax=Hibiscus syriacus TaxID=106335 RepID=A0A6A3BJM0_HIBSY|nr:hypothetical protein F3Y22_tig00110114pilonHSYRG00114 [Hibiscus syriacus]